MENGTSPVQRALTRYGLSCQIHTFTESTRTAQEAADALGCALAHIVKSLIFKTSTTGRPVLVLASGINRVSEAAVAQLVGEPLTKADAHFVREITGFVIGGVPPVGHASLIPFVFIDEDLLQYPVVWAAAGTPHTVFSLESKELRRITGGTVAALKCA